MPKFCREEADKTIHLYYIVKYMVDLESAQVAIRNYVVSKFSTIPTAKKPKKRLRVQMTLKQFCDTYNSEINGEIGQLQLNFNTFRRWKLNYDRDGDQQPQQKRTFYTRDFKIDTVKRHIVGKVRICDLCKDIDVQRTHIEKWKSDVSLFDAAKEPFRCVVYSDRLEQWTPDRILLQHCRDTLHDDTGYGNCKIKCVEGNRFNYALFAKKDIKKTHKICMYSTTFTQQE